MANNAMRSKAGMRAAKKSNATPAQKAEAKTVKTAVKSAKKIGKGVGYAGAKMSAGKQVAPLSESGRLKGNALVSTKENLAKKGNKGAVKKIDSALTGAAKKVQRKLASKGK
jgi:hypothetical protein